MFDLKKSRGVRILRLFSFGGGHYQGPWGRGRRRRRRAGGGVSLEGLGELKIGPGCVWGGFNPRTPLVQHLWAGGGGNVRIFEGSFTAE